MYFCFLMIRRPPRSTRTDTLFPYTTLFRSLEADAEGAVVAEQSRLGKRGVAQPVTGVGGVGDQLPQEDLLLRVERVRDDVEQPADLSLEIHLFFRHGLFIRPFCGPCGAYAKSSREAPLRLEKGRVGKEVVSTCRARWAPDH